MHSIRTWFDNQSFSWLKSKLYNNISRWYFCCLKFEKIIFHSFTFERWFYRFFVFCLNTLSDERGINLLSRETERERYDFLLFFYWEKITLELRGKENSQKRTATNSVSSTIFSKIFAFTSSIRSGRSIASRLVRKSSTFSSSIKSPGKM